jgi:hypothetical protein
MHSVISQPAASASAFCSLALAIWSSTKVPGHLHGSEHAYGEHEERGFFSSISGLSRLRPVVFIIVALWSSPRYPRPSPSSALRAGSQVRSARSALGRDGGDDDAGAHTLPVRPEPGDGPLSVGQPRSDRRDRSVAVRPRASPHVRHFGFSPVLSLAGLR